MRAVFAEQITILLCVKPLEVLVDLRMAHWRAGHVDQKVLLGDVGHIFRVIVFGKQMIEGLVTAGP